MAFDFPASARTDAEKAAYALAVKRALIAAHNATGDRVQKEVICLRLRIAGGIAAKFIDRLGLNLSGAEADAAAVKAAAAALASKITPEMLARIDYLTDKALTV